MSELHAEIYDQCSKVWQATRVVDEDSDIDLDDPEVRRDLNEAARLAVEAYVRDNHPALMWAACAACKHDEPMVELDFTVGTFPVCAVCGCIA